MALQEIEVGGGESVYCINQVQVRKAVELAEQNPDSSPRINRLLDAIRANLDRNEQTALAFVLIERLLKNS